MKKIILIIFIFLIFCSLNCTKEQNFNICMNNCYEYKNDKETLNNCFISCVEVYTFEK